jgi:hypothetical protein
MEQSVVAKIKSNVTGRLVLLPITPAASRKDNLPQAAT